MEESLDDTLTKAADVMHWMGQYRLCNTLILFGRLARADGLWTLEKLEDHVIAVEQAKLDSVGLAVPTSCQGKTDMKLTR